MSTGYAASSAFLKSPEPAGEYSTPRECGECGERFIERAAYWEHRLGHEADADVMPCGCSAGSCYCDGELPAPAYSRCGQ